MVTEHRRLATASLMREISSEDRVALVRALRRLVEIAGEPPEKAWAVGWES